MKIYLLCIVVLLSQYSFAQNTISNIDIIINREMKEKLIPGLQIAIVQNGKLVLNKSYGIANVQDNIPVTNSTVFPINSCTKVFTAVAVMQLAEQGKVDLSAPIGKYLDHLPAEWQTVTIEQLLTHISGFPDIQKLFDPITGNIGVLKTEEAVWEKLKSLPMDFKTGEQFSYNQTNYYLLGKIIEKVSGQSFATFFNEKQFKVVDMKHTIFGDSRDVISHYAPTYHYKTNLDGQKLNTEKLTNGYYEFPDFTRTAAGLNSTAEDIAHWIIALQKGKLLKNAATIDKMWLPAKFNNGTPTNWTRGWGLAKLRSMHKAVGMSGGSRAAFLVYPDDGLAVIVLTNLGGSYPEDFLEELAGVYNSDIVKADPITYLRINLRKMGFAKAIELVDTEKKKNPDFNPNEFELNEWAYRLMAKKQLKEALEIFKLNIHLFPESWNAYDSYGEILLKTEQKDQAIKMYQKSIELNPDNKNGKNILDQLSRPLP
ncbi:serine hydrolase [Chryseobacterium rhizosphaerae]|uniref:serine hydrolase n=1 Tax=Chryseobacterium rhizosphaerae TaxID=395937 RepID=UPI003D135807